MLRLPVLHSLNIQTIGLQHLLRIANFSSTSNRSKRSDQDIPEQWRSGFVYTAPVPEDLAADTTAFSWAKKQAPSLSLVLLGKFFRQRQVRVLQQGQVKRITKTRILEPGDILLLPKQLPQQQQQHAYVNSSSSSASDSDADEHDSTSKQHNVSQQQQQQQQQQLTHNTWQQQQGLLPWQEYASTTQQQQQLLQEQHVVEQQVAQELESLDQQFQQQKQKHQQSWDRRENEQQQQRMPLRQQQQQQPRDLTLQQIQKSVLASSRDIAVLYKPPCVSLYVPSQNNNNRATHQYRTLNPLLASALNIKPPERPQIVCDVDVMASGAVVIARNAAAYEWLSAWVAGEPAAVAAAAATLSGIDPSSSIDKTNKTPSSPRARQQQLKLKRLAAAAAAGSGSSKGLGDAAADLGFSVKELRGLVQLMEGVGGLRLRRIFWAVVQGELPVRQTGTLRSRMLRGALSLPTLTRYRVLASRDGLSWVELQPLTNRPNQLRMQCGKVLGAPVVGDFKYGYRPWSTIPAAQPWLSKYHASLNQQPRSRNSTSSKHRRTTYLQTDDIDDSDSDLHLQDSRGMDLPVGWETAGSSSSDTTPAAGAAAPEPLLLHCREVVLLRPRKAPVRVVAPLPRNMRQLLHAMDWK